MTRKDYVALAAAVARAGAAVPPCSVYHPMILAYDAMRDGIASVALAVADVLAADDPRFDSSRFLSACEITPEQLVRLKGRRHATA